jgi:diguanylate cyclase (GGDEF)-like protein
MLPIFYLLFADNNPIIYKRNIAIKFVLSMNQPFCDVEDIMSAINKLVKNDIRLPSPPSIAIRILEAAKKDNASYDELSKIIMSDPALAVKTLKAANSSFYGLSQRVDSLKKALSVLGLDAMKNIALSFVIANEMRGHTEGSFDFDFFWKRSVTAAVAADLAASSIENKNDDAFVTGLLQDIGIAIMYFCRKDDYLKVLDKKRLSESAVEVVEKEFFGFDHQELGFEVLKEWGLPENIYMPIRYHHNITDCPGKYERSTDVVHISDKISSVYHGSHSSDKITAINNVLGEKYKKSQGDIQTLIDLAAKNSIEMLSLFEIDPADMKPYSQILQEANEELGKLNLSFQQFLIKYKEERDRAEALARSLKIANEKLSSLALLDGLTGLYNHMHFQEQLDREFERALRYKRPFSLLMLDLDHFKKINDSYGHRIGDLVLKKIAALIEENVRKNDIAARYGGEEFAIIAPETDLKGAAVLAERIRASLEKTEIPADSFTIKATISIGVATYVPGKKTATKSDLFDAADSALYESKRNGRNKLSMAIVTPENN